MPNIVKHSFIKGPKIASRAMAHINYIQHRPGEDKEHGKSGERDPARPLRGPWDDDSSPGKSAHDFKQALYDKDERGRVFHKFILSPSEKDVNMDRYTQEMMSAIGRQKGQDLNYRWVVHGNTDNPHAHVVVMGKDLDGSDVRFSKLDYALMRHYGDRYLEREHGVELNLGKDRDIEMYARTHAHNLYTESTARTLKFLEEPEKKRSWISDEDFRHLLLINRNWNESLEGPSREGHLTLGETWMHDRGRLSEVHDLFQNSSNRDLWSDVQANTSDQELKDYAAKQLATLDDQRQAVMKEMGEKLGLTPDKHDQFFRDLQEQFADEWREIDQALYPEKYLPQDIDHKDIDFGRIDSEDKIRLASGDWISKYDSGSHLKDVRQDLMEGPYSARLPADEYSKLCSWIGTKQAHGDDCFGSPPLRDNIELEKSFDINDLDTRSVSLDGLSKELALDSKSLEDLVSPRLESPELKELGEIDRTHSISIEDALDAREPNSQALDQTLESIDRDDPEIDLVAIEQDLSPAEKTVQDLEPPYQVSYDIAGEKDPDIEKDADLDFEPPDFDHDLTQDQIEQTDDYEIESILDIDDNGGEEYELDDTPDRSDTPERGDDDEHRRSGDSGR